MRMSWKILFCWQQRKDEAKPSVWTDVLLSRTSWFRFSSGLTVRFACRSQTLISGLLPLCKNTCDMLSSESKFLRGRGLRGKNCAGSSWFMKRGRRLCWSAQVNPSYSELHFHTCNFRTEKSTSSGAGIKTLEEPQMKQWGLCFLMKLVLYLFQQRSLLGNIFSSSSVLV